MNHSDQSKASTSAYVPVEVVKEYIDASKEFKSASYTRFGEHYYPGNDGDDQNPIAKRLLEATSALDRAILEAEKPNEEIGRVYVKHAIKSVSPGWMYGFHSTEDMPEGTAVYLQPKYTPAELAEAWEKGYAAGVSDERTSDANIGVCGFGAKIEPARENPYKQPSISNDDEELFPIVGWRDSSGTLHEVEPPNSYTSRPLTYADVLFNDSDYKFWKHNIRSVDMLINGELRKDSAVVDAMASWSWIKAQLLAVRMMLRKNTIIGDSAIDAAVKGWSLDGGIGLKEALTLAIQRAIRVANDNKVS